MAGGMVKAGFDLLEQVCRQSHHHFCGGDGHEGEVSGEGVAVGERKG